MCVATYDVVHTYGEGKYTHLSTPFSGKQPEVPQWPAMVYCSKVGS